MPEPEIKFREPTKEKSPEAMSSIYDSSREQIVETPRMTLKEIRETANELSKHIKEKLRIEPGNKLISRNNGTGWKIGAPTDEKNIEEWLCGICNKTSSNMDDVCTTSDCRGVSLDGFLGFLDSTKFPSRRKLLGENGLEVLEEASGVEQDIEISVRTRF